MTKEKKRRLALYDGSVFKVMLLAAVLLVFSTALVGFLSYRITEGEVIKKLKTGDLSRIAQAVSGRVEGRIDRALETSQMLADDPAVVKWVRGGEADDELGRLILEKLSRIPGAYDYTNSFIVSAVSNRYWSESGKVLQTLDRSKEDDKWFYETLEAGRKTNIVVDTNARRKDTFVFANVLIGTADKPIGVAGVGLSLSKLAGNFASYGNGGGRRLWLVDVDGKIQLSGDPEQTGDYVSAYLSEETRNELAESESGRELVLETKDENGRMYDMISYPIRSSDLRLWVQIPRSETTGFLDTIKVNTAIAAIVTLILIVFLFANVSRKLADPYKRALRMNEELEMLVEGRTEELGRKNREMTDSIGYANRIQRTVLPSEADLNAAFSEHFVYWKQRDIVGGDFYWLKKSGEVTWVAVGDCTGHGVPGALMTMLSVSLLDRIAAVGEEKSPGRVLAKLNVLLKDTLHQTDPEGLTDDGLELGLCRIEGNKLTYSGAGIRMLVAGEDGVRIVQGDRKAIGYRRTPESYDYADHEFAADSGSAYYLVTDGVIDQNGGPKNVSLGKTKLKNAIESFGAMPLLDQGRQLERELAIYMGQEPQRDDMTLLAFRLAGRSGGREE
ncbi:SpoIIE family protein phosphatase [Cohnella faecalis]|uniref:Stage II sporulation protein E n=1 Tax=Cohnella faecalis TaxID=2315694 RepID=A0A398CJK6_9BACL|nr:SpoIIE family protein phosphatase [Cohnella faecalis]RIE02883.1 stage II sporulation protein E [Cohnella faecalis]